MRVWPMSEEKSEGLESGYPTCREAPARTLCLTLWARAGRAFVLGHAARRQPANPLAFCIHHDYKVNSEPRKEHYLASNRVKRLPFPNVRGYHKRIERKRRYPYNVYCN